MKYLVALLAGAASGAAALALLLYFNPFDASQTISPLAVTDERLLALQFSAVPGESLLYTNDGESASLPHPADVPELWEATIRDTRILVTELTDSRGERAGVGIKFSTSSEDTNVLGSEVLADSAWHIVMPGRGTLFVDQRENYWSFLRDIVIKARINSAGNWRGAWSRVMTSGPNALGTGRAFGGQGEFARVDSEAVESLSATAYSAQQGPVAVQGSLTVTLPDTGPDAAARRN